MKLFIDTTSNQQTIVQLEDQVLKQGSRLWHSQVVLPLIAKLLTHQKKTLKDITSIEVKTGEGSLTGIRVGQAIKQALDFALGLKP